MLKNTFKNSAAPKAAEKLKRNPPVFEDAVISFWNPGIKWMGIIKQPKTLRK